MTENNEAVAESSQEEAHNAENNESQTQTPNFEAEKKGLQEALIAERKKRQEEQAWRRNLEQQLYAREAQKQQPQDDEDEYTRELKQSTRAEAQQIIKETLERQFLEQNPQLLDQDPITGQTWLETKLEPILKKKPYLAHALQTAENRYARAMEIIEDYSPKPVQNDTTRRIQDNQNKPGSPAGIAKSGNVNKIEQLKNMSRKEFSEYRAQLRGRTPNIR